MFLLHLPLHRLIKDTKHMLACSQVVASVRRRQRTATGSTPILFIKLLLVSSVIGLIVSLTNIWLFHSVNKKENQYYI